MLERWITALHLEDAATEDALASRERLKDHFPKNSTRRMTQLGLCLGTTLAPLQLCESDTVVYASTYAETRTLEGYLDSFPNPSPTLFQTSIHPSAVQQNLILRQHAVRQFFPVTGDLDLPARALLVALLCDAPRVVLCGGEERGGWLLEKGRASDRTFAYALALSTSSTDALGRIALETAPPGGTSHPLPQAAFFDLLQARRPFNSVVSETRRLRIDWS